MCSCGAPLLEILKQGEKAHEILKALLTVETRSREAAELTHWPSENVPSKSHVTVYMCRPGFTSTSLMTAPYHLRSWSHKAWTSSPT